MAWDLGFEEATECLIRFPVNIWFTTAKGSLNVWDAALTVALTVVASFLYILKWFMFWIVSTFSRVCTNISFVQLSWKTNSLWSIQIKLLFLYLFFFAYFFHFGFLYLIPWRWVPPSYLLIDNDLQHFCLFRKDFKTVSSFILKASMSYFFLKTIEFWI